MITAITWIVAGFLTWLLYMLRLPIRQYETIDTLNISLDIKKGILLYIAIWPVFLMTYIGFEIADKANNVSKRYINVFKLKHVDNLGYHDRTIFGYKGRIFVCTASSIYGELPENVISRINSKYKEEQELKEKYLEAVYSLT